MWSWKTWPLARGGSAAAWPITAGAALTADHESSPDRGTSRPLPSSTAAGEEATRSTDEASSAPPRHPGGAGAEARPFNLLRSYALWSSCTIAALALVAGSVFVAFLEQHLIERDVALSQALAQSIVDAAWPTLASSPFAPNAPASSMHPLFTEIARMPEIVRIKVFAADGVVVWASDGSPVGAASAPMSGDNAELLGAINGDVHFSLTAAAASDGKREHQDLPASVAEFIEIYVPIFDRERTRVTGVLELYKSPDSLLETLAQARRLVWATALVGGALLFAALYIVVRRGQAVIAAQRERLVEAETLSGLGELSMAVAHSIRNPLAAMRSSAELSLEQRPSEFIRDGLTDIIEEVDRLNGWLNDYLLYFGAGLGSPRAVDLGGLARRSLEGFDRIFSAAGIELVWRCDTDVPAVLGHEALLAHLINSVVANAVEAMPTGGRLEVLLRRMSGPCAVELIVRDSGVGMSAGSAVGIGESSGKPGGLGMGLPLVRRIVARHGAQLDFEDTPRGGTTVRARFSVAPR